MLHLERQHPVFLNRLTLHEATMKDGERRYRARLKLEAPLDESELDALPISSDAVRALLKESQGIEEGKNTVKLAFKRDLGTFNSTFIKDEGARKRAQMCTVIGEVKNSPSVVIVLGALSVLWEVEALIDADALSFLANLIDEDGVDIVSKPAQGELFEAAS